MTVNFSRRGSLPWSEWLQPEFCICFQVHNMWWIYLQRQKVQCTEGGCGRWRLSRYSDL